MPPVVCPKCGFEQDAGSECLRCGIIFARYVPPQEPSPPPEPRAPVARQEEGPGLLVRFYRVFRWVVLAGAVLVLVLLLRPGSPPEIDTHPQAATHAQQKMQRLEQATTFGPRQELRLSEAELNSYLRSNLALADSAPAPPSAEPPPTPTAARPGPTPEPGVEQVRFNVSDLRIDLAGDQVRAYIIFDFWGMDLSLLLEGHLRVEQGYLRLEPSRVKLGSLPVPRATVQGAVDRLFDSPENREKFRLPPEIEDVRVEDGELVIVHR